MCLAIHRKITKLYGKLNDLNFLAPLIFQPKILTVRSGAIVNFYLNPLKHGKRLSEFGFTLHLGTYL